jgi:multidrug efflux system outer membrane protein
MARPMLMAALAAALAGCTLAPAYQRPAPPIPQAWPAPAPAPQSDVSAAALSWREVFTDARLQGVITLALRENRDLRIALANIAKARAQYGVQRAQLLPSVDATGAMTESRTPAAIDFLSKPITQRVYSAQVGFTAYEVDLFGRVRSLTEAARQSYLASEEDRRTAQISLIAEVAADYVALAADEDLLALDQQTLQTRQDSERLTQRMFDDGAASALDLRQAQTLTEQSRSDVAGAVAAAAQAKNALRLVVGADIPDDLAPAGGLSAIQIRQDLPPGLPSQVLLRRPDVLSAEHALMAQNADIGAARAAFFPQISLTGQAGSESLSLGGLFSGGGSSAWSFGPQISLPLFHGGANIAGLESAKAGRDAAVAQYEKAVQTAFREVADALAVRATINDQVDAQVRQEAAASDAERLSKARFDRGVDSFLVLLDSERALYAAQTTLLNTRLAEVTNRITLYKALGGGAEP